MENNIRVALKAIVVHNCKALIIKRSNYIEFAAGTWEFVGGGMEFGEDLITALKREVMEETGLVVEIDRILYAATFKSTPIWQIVMITYLCRTDDNTIVLSNEHTDYLWATKEQLCELLPDNILADLKLYALDSLEIDDV